MFLDNIKAGPVAIEMRMKNHEPFRRRVQIRPYEISVVNTTLTPITGLLKLEVNPASELYVDGRLVQKEASSVRLPLLASTHEVMLANPRYGQWVKNVDIAAADSVDLSVDFTQTLKLIVTTFDTGENGMHAEIVLDGRPTGLYTPTPIEIPVGVHKLEVRAEGYEMVEEATEKNYDASVKGPLRLVLRKSN